MKYANIIYPLIPKQLNGKKQKLQNRALRIIFAHEDYLSREELHFKANLTSIEQRADKQLLCTMYKRSLNPVMYPQLLSTGNTRSSENIKFKIPLPKYERYKHYPLYHGAKLWDLLTPQIQRSGSRLAFKNQLPRGPDFIRYPV